jgi:hypothetical protein
MPIPKTIYQTWKTKELHTNIVALRENIQILNPDYSIVLYDDDDMDAFISSNFGEYTYQCYSKLNVGAAKADFWRYCILYKYGGVYLDIDSDILQPLDELICHDDSCIITREGNDGFFNNWIMIFEKEHPILLKTIENCCYNITNKTTHDICYLTGPHGPFTKAINSVLIPYYTKTPNIENLYFENDNDLNEILNNETNTIRARFYGVDMGVYAKWKHDFCNDLYQNFTYWRYETEIFKNDDSLSYTTR